MEVDGPDISKYGVVVQMVRARVLRVWWKNLKRILHPQTCYGRYVLTADIFDTLRGLNPGSGGEIQLADAINKHAQQGSVETVGLNGLRFDCGSVEGYMAACFHMFRKRT